VADDGEAVVGDRRTDAREHDVDAGELFTAVEEAVRAARDREHALDGIDHVDDVTASTRGLDQARSGVQLDVAAEDPEVHLRRCYHSLWPRTIMGMQRRAAAAVAMLVSALAACTLPAPNEQVSALGAPHVLYLDFHGASISAGASDDAVMSIAALGSAIVPSFDASIVAPDVSAAELTAVLVDRVRTMYLPFGVTIVTEAPTSGDYARILVGGTAAVLTPPAPSSSAGVSTLDCVDANPRSVGFAFSDEAAPKFGGPVALAATIAHEAGHGYGLEHVTTTTDPMYAAGIPQQMLADLFALAFSGGPYSPFTAGGGSQPESCGRASPLDNVAILSAALGTRTATSAPPAVKIDFPPPGASLPSSVALAISASDDVAVHRVEVYRDLTLVAVLTDPPYALTLALPTAAATRITVEAVDDDAQRASTALEFAADPMSPAPCDAAHLCATGMKCESGRCAEIVAPEVDGGDAAADLGTRTSDGGCSLAHRTPSSAASFVCLLVLAFVLRRARSRLRDC